MKRCGWLLLSCWLFVGVGYAQTSEVVWRPVLAAEPVTEAERQVQELLQKKGIHVVHLWSPRCHNSMSELENP